MLELVSHFRGLRDALEYKFLIGCIQDHHQQRIALEAYDGEGFPFSPLQGKQGRTRKDEWVAAKKCVRCMQGLCCGFGTRRPSNLEAFCKKASRGPLSVLLSVYEVNRFYGLPSHSV